MHAVQLLEGHTASWGRGDGDDPWADLEQHGIHRRELSLTVPEKVLTPTQLAQGPQATAGDCRDTLATPWLLKSGWWGAVQSAGQSVEERANASGRGGSQDGHPTL